VSGPDHTRYLRQVLAGRFLVDRLLGQGAFAWVFHAYTRSGEEVAIKVLHTSDPTADIRFARETQVLAALGGGNPAVAAYVDHGRTDEGCPYLALEFVDGITLLEAMTRRPMLAMSAAVTFVAELCEAFAGLHQLGVAHRDVKPENILLARQGGIKLIDFGLIRDAQGILKLLEEQDPFERRLFAEELDRRSLVGTPEYMAPEQFSDASAYDLSLARTDTWSDVFSLGVILYQLLSGHKPFPMRVVAEAEFPREILRYMRWRTSLRDEHVPACPDIDPALSSILRKALRQDPRRRQPDARALHQELTRYLATGEGVESDEVPGTVSLSIAELASLRHGSPTPAPRTEPAAEFAKPGPDFADDVDGMALTTIAPIRDSEPPAASVHSMETLITPAFIVAETIPEAEFRGPGEPVTPVYDRSQRAARWVEAPTIVDERSAQLDDAETAPRGEAPGTTDANGKTALEGADGKES
jgi:serine/threonine protein kinase